MGDIKLDVATFYACRLCEQEVRAPGYGGRSWCKRCEMYLIPDKVVREPEPEGDEKPEGSDHKYVYTTWRPKANKMERDERPDHRFAYLRRNDSLVPNSKPAYKARCTCGKWKNPNGFTNRRAARFQWQAHMAEVEKQQTLPIT